MANGCKNPFSILTALLLLLPTILTFPFYSHRVESKSIPEGYYIRSDAIVTKWPTKSPTPSDVEQDERNIPISMSPSVRKEPGWMKQQLLKFGQVASKVGSAMGAHANKISRALDKVCEVIKTVIPLLAAVCHVGEFGFCSATDEAPLRLSEAINPQDLNLDGIDK